MKINLNNKQFKSLSNTSNGEVNNETIFTYHQDGNMVWADYKGGQVKKGHLIGIMYENHDLKINYHHINNESEIMIGECYSTFSALEDGTIKYLENWKWLNGDQSSGQSEIIEIKHRPKK